jgi:hypothetical protein
MAAYRRADIRIARCLPKLDHLTGAAQRPQAVRGEHRAMAALSNKGKEGLMQISAQWGAGI